MSMYFGTVLSLAFGILFATSGVSAAESTEPLGAVAARALAEGKDAKLNTGFARLLGLEVDQPLPLKRLDFAKEAVTNSFNVLRDDPDTIILSERRRSVTTYYLTDRSGNLKRAVVNNSAIADGGLTNLALAAAASDFAKLKQLWLERKAH